MPDYFLCRRRVWYITITRIVHILQVSTTSPRIFRTSLYNNGQNLELCHIFFAGAGSRRSMMWDINFTQGLCMYCNSLQPAKEFSALCTYTFTNAQKWGLCQTIVLQDKGLGNCSRKEYVYISSLNNQPLQVLTISP